MNTMQVALRLTAAGVALAVSHAFASAQTTTRVSVSSVGIASDTTGEVAGAALTPDGRLVAFASSSSTLIAADGNFAMDVFLHDRQTGAVERVSLTSAGGEANGLSASPAISADGNVVAFHSSATNLVAGDTNNQPDVFVRDRSAGVTERVSIGSAGQQGNGSSVAPAISADGNVVVFGSKAFSFGIPDVNLAQSDLFARDRAAGTLAMVDVNASGVQSNGFMNQFSACNVSADGRFVAFPNSGDNLVGNDTNVSSDVFVKDRATGAVIRANVDGAGQQSSGGVLSPLVLTPDARFVVFATDASDLAAGDTNLHYDVYLRDLVLGATELVSIDPTGQAGNASSTGLRVSDDARFVAFSTDATNLLIGDSAPGGVLVRDRALGFTFRASVSTLGQLASDGGVLHAISGDGRHVAFGSESSGLVAGDEASSEDVFAFDAGAYAPVASYCTAKPNSLGCTPRIGASGAPLASGFDAFFLTAQHVLNKKNGIVFWGLAPQAAAFAGGTLCVKTPLVRGPVQSSGGLATGSSCTGVYYYHFSQAYMSSRGLGAGSTVHAQFWSRDPGFAAPDNVGLTDALAFTIAP